MKKMFWGMIFFIFLGILITCSKDPLQKGDAAFQKAKYAEALKNYLEAYEQNPDNPDIGEKVALTYFKAGETLFKRRKVLPAFEVRVEKGSKYIPESPSENFKKELSRTYLELARAYQITPPENRIQKQQFFKKTLQYLELAVESDPENQVAQQALNDFMDKNFAEMLNKGIRYYQQGKQDPESYLAAEYYLQRALKFKPDNTDAQKYLTLARKAGLAVLDLDQKMPIAITDMKRKGNKLAYYVILRNNSDQSVPVSGDKFHLIAQDNTRMKGGVTREFSNPFPSQTLDPDQEAEGVVTFELSGRKKFVRMEYVVDEKTLGYKNLP